MEGANAQVPVPVDADAWRLAGQGWQWHSSSCGSCSHSSRDLCLAGDECRHPSADSQEGQQGSTQQLRSAARHLCTEMNGQSINFLDWANALAGGVLSAFKLPNLSLFTQSATFCISTGEKVEGIGNNSFWPKHIWSSPYAIYHPSDAAQNKAGHQDVAHLDRQQPIGPSASCMLRTEDSVTPIILHIPVCWQGKIDWLSGQMKTYDEIWDFSWGIHIKWKMTYGHLWS